MLFDTEALNRIPNDQVFRVVLMETDFMTGKMEKLLFVAKKGLANDWAIYTMRPMGERALSFNISNCVSFGDKVTTFENIKKVVPCTEDVLKYYRR
jgi:hypothetical protein